MLLEVRGSKSRFKVDTRNDFMEKVGLEEEAELGWNVRKEEVIHKPGRNKNAPISCGEERRMSAVMVSDTSMGRVEWKLEGNILRQMFPYELSWDKAKRRRAGDIRLALTESQEWYLYL